MKVTSGRRAISCHHPGLQRHAAALPVVPGHHAGEPAVGKGGLQEPRKHRLAEADQAELAQAEAVALVRQRAVLRQAPPTANLDKAVASLLQEPSHPVLAPDHVIDGVPFVTPRERVFAEEVE